MLHYINKNNNKMSRLEIMESILYLNNIEYRVLTNQNKNN